MVGCLAAWVGAIAVTIADGGEEAVRAAAVQALVIGAPLAVGVLEWRPGARYPRMLIAIGGALAVVTLSATDVPVLFSLGRIALWLLAPAVVTLVLAYPSGRLDGPLDVPLVSAAFAVAVGLYILPLPWTVEFPGPFPWATCGADCPHNAFAVVDTQPAVIDDLLRPVREAAVVALLGVVTAVLARRTVTAHPVLRGSLMPVLSVARVAT